MPLKKRPEPRHAGAGSQAGAAMPEPAVRASGGPRLAALGAADQEELARADHTDASDAEAQFHHARPCTGAAYNRHWAQKCDASVLQIEKSAREPSPT